VAELYSLNFHRAARQSAFQPALDAAMQEPGFSLIEVMIDRQQSLERHRVWLDGVLRD